MVKSLPIFLIPSWIFSAFTARHNLQDIHQYSKLRQIFSLSDLAAISILTRHLLPKYLQKVTDGDCSSGFTDLLGKNCYWGESSEINALIATPEEWTEIESNLRFMVGDQRIEKETLSRLEKPPKSYECEAVSLSSSIGEAEKTKVPYSVIVLPRAVYVSVEEGFLSHLAQKEDRKKFFTTVLKAGYSVCPIPVVHESSLYSQYLNTLA